MHQRNERNHLSGVPLVLAAGILWGTVGPAQVLADSPASPITLGDARILSGGVLLAAFVLVTNPGAFRALSRAAWRPLLAASVATGIFQAAFLTSVDRTGAAVATAVVFGVAPVTTGLCERMVLRTRLSRRWAGGTACAVAGVALLTAPGSAGSADLLGVALGLVGGCCFGVYTVSAKRLVDHQVGMTAAVSVTLLAGGTLLLPLSLRGVPDLAGTRSLALVAWLGLATTAVAYMCFVNGLRRVTAATAGTLSLAEPLVAAVLAVAVLGERLTLPVTAGALALLGGLVLVSLPGRRHPAPVVEGPVVEGPVVEGPVCWPDVTGAVKVDSTTGERS